MTTMDTVTDTAEVIEPKPAGQSGHRQTTDTVTGQGRVVGVWVTTDEAAMRLGVSERTIRRRVKGGQIPTRVWGGRRQVRLDPPDTPDSTPDTGADGSDAEAGQHGHRQMTGTMTGTTAAELATLTRDIIERQDVVVRQDLRRARRWAGLGLTATIVLIAGAAGGGVWAVRAIEQAATAAGIAEARADAAEASLADEAILLDAEREFSRKLAAELVDAKADAAAAEAEAHRLKVEAMRQAMQVDILPNWINDHPIPGIDVD